MRGRKPEWDAGNVVPMRNGAGDAIKAPADPCPDPPLELAARGLEVWAELAPVLHAKGRLRAHHRYQFAVYCNAVASYLEAQIVLECEGVYYTIKGRNGQQSKRHAAWQARQDAAAEMRRGSDEWGMSALSESRLGGDGQGDLFSAIREAIENGPD